jgi:predicted lipid carrier protein YhbT
MLPFGLEVSLHKPVKKTPMRLGIHTLEEKMKHFYKMLNIEQKEEHTRKRRVKKNKTSKLKKN